MLEDGLKQKTLYGLIWQFAEKIGAQVISFIVSIILARFLTPDDYGLVGLVTVFITIALVFAQSGMGQALVQKKDADDIDYSTVLYYSIAFSVIIYIVLFVSAGLIADFYGEAQFVPMMRVLGLTVIVGAVSSVQQAIVQRNMQFKLFFAANSVGTIVSGIIGVVMAICNFGVWSLIVQQLSTQLINVVTFGVILGWKPKICFSFTRMKQLFGYSWKLLCSTLIDTVYHDIYSLVIGKSYSSADLGYYNRGKQFPVLFIQNINGAVNGVLFPVLSKIQDKSELMKSAVRRSVRTSTYLIFPFMAGLAAVAEPLVKLLLTEIWLPAVPFIRFCCFTYAFWPVHTANLQAIKALGRSDTFLKLEIIKKVIGIIILLITIPFGLTVMMCGKCVMAVISSFINAVPNKKLMNYSLVEQYKDMLPPAVMSLAMMCAVMPLSALALNSVVIMVIQIAVGALIYIGMSVLFRIESFNYVKNTIIEIIKKR